MNNIIDVDRGEIINNFIILTRLSGLAALKAIAKTILKESMHFFYFLWRWTIIFTRRLDMFNT